MSIGRSPRASTLAVQGGEYTLCRPRLNQCYQGSTKSGKAPAKTSGMLGFSLSMSGSQVKNQFNVELAGEGTLYDGGPHVWMLKLTPKGAAGYKFAEVWVSDDGMPVQTRVTEKNGDSTTRPPDQHPAQRACLDRRDQGCPHPRARRSSRAKAAAG